MDCITNCEDAKNGENRYYYPAVNKFLKAPCMSKGFLHFTDKRIMLFVRTIKDIFFNFSKSSSHFLYLPHQYKMIYLLVVWNPLTLVQRTGTFHWQGPALFDPVRFRHFPDQVYLCKGVDQYTPVTCHNQSTNEMNCSTWHLFIFFSCTNYPAIDERLPTKT